MIANYGALGDRGLLSEQTRLLPTVQDTFVEERRTTDVCKIWLKVFVGINLTSSFVSAQESFSSQDFRILNIVCAIGFLGNAVFGLYLMYPASIRYANRSITV